MPGSWIHRALHRRPRFASETVRRGNLSSLQLGASGGQGDVFGKHVDDSAEAERASLRLYS